MREPFQDTLRVRMPASLTERLRLTARRYARSPSDMVREAVVVQLDRLNRKASEPPDNDPPLAA